MGSNLLGLGSGLFDGVADADIGHATAKVTGHDGIDVLIGWGGKVVDERRRLHDLARLAVTALRDLKVRPRLLHRVSTIRIESLNGRDLSAGDAGQRRYAGAGRTAADMNRAGAAHPDAAAEFRSGEADDVADYPQQRRVVLGVDRHRAAIDVKRGHVQSPTAGSIGSAVLLANGRDL